jgi:hypothetical protein
MKKKSCLGILLPASLFDKGKKEKSPRRRETKSKQLRSCLEVMNDSISREALFIAWLDSAQPCHVK